MVEGKKERLASIELLRNMRRELAGFAGHHPLNCDSCMRLKDRIRSLEQEINDQGKTCTAQTVDEEESCPKCQWMEEELKIAKDSRQVLLKQLFAYEAVGPDRSSLQRISQLLSNSFDLLYSVHQLLGEVCRLELDMRDRQAPPQSDTRSP